MEAINETKTNELQKILEDYNTSMYSIYREISNIAYQIRNFWLISLKHSKMFIINQKDETILSHLISINYEYAQSLEFITFYFRFEKNFYFEESTLFKRYYYEQPADLLNIFQNNIIKTENSNITWLSHNPTIEYIKNKRKQWKKVDSFFNLFDTSSETDIHLLLHLFLKHVLEYYLNIIPAYN